MIILREPNLSEITKCPYFGELTCRFRYFFARGLSGEELNILLTGGWRKFGTYYFKPECGNCRRCIPVRVPVMRFAPGRSQRRVLKKAQSAEVRFGPLDYRQEIYDIYRDHSFSRFGRETDEDEFITTFYNQSCPSMQSEYSYNGNLFGVGFLDRSSEALSSMYFTFRKEYSGFSPGILSIIKEIEFAAAMDLSYYYLGYYIALNGSMSYKNRFHPYEWYDWESAHWLPETVADRAKTGI